MAAAALILVCDFNAHGGTQTQVLELLASVDRGRYRPRLCTLNLDESLAGRVRALDVPVTNLGLRGALRLHTWRALSGLAGLIREEKVKVVHGFLFQGNLAAASAARWAGAPYVTSVRNLELWKRPHQVLASRWAHSGAAAVTFNSRNVRDLVCRREGIPKAKTRVILNGLSDAAGGPVAAERGPGAPDPRAAWPPGSSPRLLCVASLFPKKGLSHLLDAFALLRTSHPGAGLVLAGRGPEKDALEAKARTMGLAERVVLACYRSDARALLAAADVLVLPSLEEGLPNVLLEAMAAGVPQIATSVGGSPEAVDDGVTGYLVPPRDPVLLAERIRHLVSDGGRSARMAAASRDRFARLFSAARMAREHESLYDEILGSRA